MKELNGIEGLADRTLAKIEKKMAEPDPPGIELKFLIDGEVKTLLTINPDGTITKGEAFTTDDESSLKFWDLIFASFPGWRRALVEKAIAERIARAAREYEFALRSVCAAGLVDSAFDSSAPEIMRLKLDNILKFLSTQVVRKQ